MHETDCCTRCLPQALFVRPLPINGEVIPDNLFELVRDSFYLRGGAIGLVQFFCSVRYLRAGGAGQNDGPKWIAVQAARITIQMAVQFGLMLLSFRVVDTINTAFGFNPTVIISPVPVGTDGERLAQCVFESSGGCEYLSIIGDVPGRMKALRDSVDTVRTPLFPEGGDGLSMLDKVALALFYAFPFNSSVLEQLTQNK